MNITIAMCRSSASQISRSRLMYLILRKQTFTGPTYITHDSRNVYAIYIFFHIITSVPWSRHGATSVHKCHWCFNMTCAWYGARSILIYDISNVHIILAFSHILYKTFVMMNHVYGNTMWIQIYLIVITSINI